MKSHTILFAFCIFSFAGLSQVKYPSRKLSIEPAIGLRLSSAFGLVDFQLSGLVQYQVNKRISLASHSAFSFDINSFAAFKNIKVKKSMTNFQRFGIGTSFYSNKGSHTFFFMAGVKDFKYSASINNPLLEDNVNSQFKTVAFDKGMLYNIKVGRGNPYFSGRVYAPVFDGKWIAIENASLELGAGFKIK